jgi:peptide/nickel transport system permease protein
MTDELTDDPKIRQAPVVPTMSVGVEGATAFTPATPAGEADVLGDGAPLGVEAAGLEVKSRSQWAYARRRFFRHKLAMISLVVLAVILLAGVFADVIAPYSYDEIDLENTNSPPTLEDRHYFGTDVLGRDYFSRVVYGIRTTESVAFLVAALSTLIGVVVGAMAGYYGGWVDNLLMRFTDLVLILPALAVLLTAAAFLGNGSPLRVSVILALIFWTVLARIVRGSFLSLREKEYVEAAKAAGSGDARIMFRHILPNTIGPIVVNATLIVGVAILTEAALSLLGFGIQPPTPALGKLIADGQTQGLESWWLVTFPGLVIVVIALAVNFVGDGLRDAFDPKSTR